MAKIPNTRFPLKDHGYRGADGKIYIFDAALVPALQHVPPDLLLPLIRALARDFSVQHRKWAKAQKQVRDRRDRWIKEAIDLHLKGVSNAGIGARLSAKGYGSADWIARTLGWYIRRKK